MLLERTYDLDEDQNILSNDIESRKQENERSREPDDYKRRYELAM